MINQGESPNRTTQCNGFTSTFGYLAIGLGIGTALSIFLAPKSGQQTREWIADKCMDAIDTANEKVRVSRMHVRETMDRGQEQISKAVAARRHTIARSNATAN
jgi:gas vesicle protein